MEHQIIFVRIAVADDLCYIPDILKETKASAFARGTGIAKRSFASVASKILNGHAVIALTVSGQWVGFSYLQAWQEGQFVSNSGLIVAPAYRQSGVAKAIKERIFKMSRRMYPEAKIFSITSGSAVMKLNSRLGFKPVAYTEIVRDPSFWEGCKGCVNYEILQGKKQANCLCTAMLFDPLENLTETAPLTTSEPSPFIHN